MNSFVKLNSTTRRGGKLFQVEFDHSSWRETFVCPPLSTDARRYHLGPYSQQFFALYLLCICRLYFENDSENDPKYSHPNTASKYSRNHPPRHNLQGVVFAVFYLCISTLYFPLSLSLPISPRPLYSIFHNHCAPKLEVEAGPPPPPPPSQPVYPSHHEYCSPEHYEQGGHWSNTSQRAVLLDG